MIKKIVYGLVFGSVLGLVCIVGARLRSTESLENWYLFAFWFNRFLMGFVFALLPLKTPLNIKIIRGIAIGILVSFAFYSATNYQDFLGFIVGGLYGVIIEVAFHFLFVKKSQIISKVK